MGRAARDVPERLGPCRLLREIGSGATGTVYLAEMAEERPYAAEGERVAVKVLHPGVARRGEAFARFVREGRLGSLLDDDAVVATHDADMAVLAGAEVHFLVMEHVEGRTLRQLFDEMTPVPEPLLRDLGTQVARGLAAVHEHGAVHRDIKPENVLVTPGHRVKIMDLGVALLHDDELASPEGGGFAGSPSYASPEQFMDDAVGAAADLYALGVTLYEGATGTHPFRGASVDDVMRRHLTEAPPKAGELNPRVSPFLEEALATLLEKDPLHRFGSARELADVLEAGEDSWWWREREKALRQADPRGELRAIHVPRETALVGREAELAELRTMLDEARVGRGRFVLIEGEAGAGKTRLLDELARGVRERGEAQVLYGSNPPGGGGRRRGALAQAVIGRLGEAEIERSLASYLTVTPDLAPAFAAWLLGTSGPAGSLRLTPEALHAAFSQLARGLARERPLVLVVEDLHFGDGESTSILASLARIAAGERMLLVGTTRPGLPLEDLALLQSPQAACRLPLGALDAAGVTRLLREVLRSQPLAERLGPIVAEKSDGNAYFALEIIRRLRRDGVLREREDGAFELTGRAEDVAPPTSVGGLLRSRLQGVTEGERDLLDVGSVEGFAFDPDLVARVLGRERLDVLQALARLERGPGLVRASGGGFRFEHHLLQELVAKELPDLLRQEYHGALAEAFEARGSFAAAPPDEIPGEEAVFMAEHFALGARTEPARRLVLRALAHLDATYQNERLLRLSRARALRLGEDAALRCDALAKEDGALDRLGRRTERQAAAEDAVAAAIASADAGREAQARHRLGLHLIWINSLEAAHDCLELGRDLARQAGDARTEAGCVGALGIACLEMRRFERARELGEQCLALAREHGFRVHEARAVGNLGNICQVLGEYGAAHERFAQHLDLSAEIGDRYGEAIAAGNLGVLCGELGRLEEARGHLERQLALFRGMGDRPGEVLTSCSLGSTCRDLGLLEEARRHLENARALARETGHLEREAQALHALGLLSLDEGHIPPACALLEEAARLVERWGFRDPGPLAAARLAVLGRRDPAAIAVPDESPAPLRAEAHVLLHRAGAPGEHLARAREIVERMSAHLSGDDLERFLRFNPVARMLDEASHPQAARHDERGPESEDPGPQG